MPKKEDVYGSSETGNWNVAARFSEVKIMMPLEKCEIYEDIAKFGHHSYLDQLNNQTPTDVIRITALDRLVNELIKIGKNTLFAMRKRGTLDDMKKIVERLEKVKKLINLLYTEKIDKIRKTKNIILKEKEYREVLDVVLDIKSEINEPLNRNDLIFTSKEIFDPKAAKELIKEQLTNVG